MEDAPHSGLGNDLEFTLRDQTIRITKMAQTPKGPAFRLQFISPYEGSCCIGLNHDCNILQGPFTIPNEQLPMVMTVLREFFFPPVADLVLDFCRRYAATIGEMNFPGSEFYRR